MKEQKIKKLMIVLLMAAMLWGCAEYQENSEETEMTYTQISAQKAYEMMYSEKEYVILDVREQSEYDEGHIAGAIVMPYTQTETMAPNLVPDKTEMILVYCRSGRRSKIAAEKLAEMGYSNVYEFGGIIDWPYEIVQ